MPDPIDPTDERIRELLTQAVAEAPPAPSPTEITHPAVPVVAPDVVVRVDRSRWDWLGNGGGRTLRAAAASIVVLALVVAGASLSDRLGGDVGKDDEQAPTTTTQLTTEPLRFVPTVVPDGMELQHVSDEPDDGLALPAVAVYENDDVSVRIVTDPLVLPVWFSGQAAIADSSGGTGSTGTTGPVATTGPPISGLTGGEPTTTLAPTTDMVRTTETTSTLPATTVPTTTPTTQIPATIPPASPTSSTTFGPTTTSMPPGGDPAVGRLGRIEGIDPVLVRGGPGGVEVHDDTTVTVWFAHGDLLIAVDVTGLDRDAAIALVDRLEPDAEGGFVPAADDGLQLVADAPAVGVTDWPAAPTFSLRYTDPDQPEGHDFVVTTVQLPGGRLDPLVGTAGWSGRTERWGDRDVVVDDDGLDGDGAEAGSETATAAFVDPSGVLVIVQGPPGDLRPYVDGLDGVDEATWQQQVGEDPDTSPEPTG